MFTPPSAVQHESALGPGQRTATFGDDQLSEVAETPTLPGHGEAPPNRPRFVSLWDLADMPLLGVYQLGILTLRWGEDASGDATEMAFQVTGLTRGTSKAGVSSTSSGNSAITTVQLSGGYRCVITHESATLHDPTGSVVHSMVKVHEERGQSKLEPAAMEDQFLNTRRLEPKPAGGMFKKPKETGFAPVFLPNGPPPQPQGPPTSFMDAYCRYGCGGMSGKERAHLSAQKSLPCRSDPPKGVPANLACIPMSCCLQ